jgi:ABC-2 type transport system permease protein
LCSHVYYGFVDLNAMRFRDNSKHLARTWLSGARASLVREMEFRGNFVIGLIRQALWLAAFLFLIDIIFRNTESLAGWSRNEVVIILALSRVVEGTIGVLFTDNIMRLTSTVQKGTFDFILTKPLPSQFAAFFTRLSYESIGNVLTGLILLVYIAIQSPEIFTLAGSLLTILMSILGITVYYSLLIMVGSLVFYIDRLEALWSFNVLFSEPLTVPFDVFPRGPRIALTYLLPLAFVVFVPAQALTGRLTLWQVPVAIGIAAAFLLLANIAWRAGLRRYSSASS